MSLPLAPLATGTVEIADSEVSFRSLSRAEAFKLNGFQGREDEAEIFIIATATGNSESDVAKWREEVSLDDAGKLIDAILVLSGLATEGEDGIVVPKARPSRALSNGR